MKFKIVVSFIFLVFLLGAAFIPSLQTSASTPSFSSLRGVDYNSMLCGCNIQSITPPPSSFSMISSSGWNLIKVYLSWVTYQNNPSTYITNLKAVASSAESNGIYVIYNMGATADAGCSDNVWPCTMYNICNNGDAGPCPAFWSALYANQITPDDWSAQWNNFWSPIINAVGSNPSTLGYEILNEPLNPGSAPASQIQQYNQYFAGKMRSVMSSSQYVLFMGTCNNPDACGYGGSGSLGVVQQAPTGLSNIAIDFHRYADNSTINPGGGASSDFAYYAEAGQELNMPVLIGEWAVCGLSYPDTCSTITQSQATQVVQSYEGLFQQYGFANTYFDWDEANQISPSGGNLMKLLNQNGQQYWLDSAIEQYQGPSVSVSFSTTMNTVSGTQTQTTTSQSGYGFGSIINFSFLNTAFAFARTYTSELELIMIVFLAAALVGYLKRRD